MKKQVKKVLLSMIFVLSFSINILGASKILVFQSDFGLKDGAVSAMKGVAVNVDKELKIYDLTHEIPAYSIWEASYRLYQTAEYWPSGTVFVSIVDPGVGTERLSVVLKTKSGHYFVTPDNGTLTLVSEKFGIDEIRQIDEAVNRRKNSEKSYTFHGRDVYAYTAARLASGDITFEQVGKKLPSKVETIILSPFSMNKGTITRNPVSRRASFWALAAVFPFTPGGQSITLSATFSGT